MTRQKFQVPGSEFQEAPSSKLQSTRTEVLELEDWNFLEFGTWNLELGTWNL
jgi:hypothetical protein